MLRHKENWNGQVDVEVDDMELDLNEGFWVNSALVTFQVEYIGYDEGERYDRNGTGTPPSGGYARALDVLQVENVKVTRDDGSQVDTSSDWDLFGLQQKVKTEILRKGLDNFDDEVTEELSGYFDD